VVVIGKVKYAPAIDTLRILIAITSRELSFLDSQSLWNDGQHPDDKFRDKPDISLRQEI
jgi:hypothetical protein